MTDRARSVIDFYDRHPISLARVLAALGRRQRDVRALVPEDLYEWDQDHYGGVAAVETLARRAGIGPASVVLDVCAGLGGPARFLAARHGCRVVGVDLNQGRCAGARQLSVLVRLTGRVAMINADAQSLPFKTGSFTAVVSQEGLLHVPDKAAALGECGRVLVPGGRIAFSDWIAGPRLDDAERRCLGEWMAATTLQSIEGYRRLLGRAGFTGIEAEDASAEWVAILRERVRAFTAMREDTVARLGHTRYEEYHQLHAFFVGLVEAGKMGGARFSATAYRGAF
jgi:sarcosine/dimethylglycine N-methyltransferase